MLRAPDHDASGVFHQDADAGDGVDGAAQEGGSEEHEEVPGLGIDGILRK
jgi:hypothetical protein